MLIGVSYDRIYRYALVQEGNLYVGPDRRLPATPALLQTCKQIRAEASSIFFAENSLVVFVRNFDIRRVVRWLDLSPARDELYRNSEVVLKVFLDSVDSRRPPSPPRRRFRNSHDIISSNLFTWVDYYCQHRCRRIVHLPTDKPEPPTTFAWWWIDRSVTVFDTVDEILENNHQVTTKDLHSQVAEVLRNREI